MPSKKQICPVCHEPLGNDPHEACFEQIEDSIRQAPDTEPIPCPACGQPMEHMACKNEACENYFPG